MELFRSPYYPAVTGYARQVDFHGFQASMKKDIWNFDHEILEDLKTFLRMFN